MDNRLWAILMVVAIIVILAIVISRSTVDCICGDPDCGGGCNPKRIKRR